MSSAFIPLFAKMPSLSSLSPPSKEGGDNKIDRGAPLSKEEFYFTIFWLLAATMIVVVLLGVAFSEAIASFLFILQDEKFHKVAETSLLIKILFPYIGFISLCSLQQGVLENHGRFAYSASVPVLFNLIAITTATAVLLYEEKELVGITEAIFGVIGLGMDMVSVGGESEIAWSQTLMISLGVISGGMGQLGYAFWGARRLGYRIWPFSFNRNRGNVFSGKRIREYFSHPSVKRFLLLLLPVFLASGSYQIQILLTEPIVLSLGEGAVSILYYASRLLEFPLGIVGVAVTVAALPLLSQAASRIQKAGGKENFLKLIHDAINTVYVFFFPVLVVSCFYPETIVSIVFEFNRFTRQDTLDTALTFLVLIPSLFSLSGYRILFNVFYALENTRLPLFISSINLILGVPLAFILTRLHPHPAMVALGSMISSYLMLGVSLWLLHRRGLSLIGFVGERTRFFLGMAVLIVPTSYIVHRLIDPIFRVLEKSATGLWTVKLVYVLELGFFSLWVFFLTLMVLILLRDPQAVKLLSKFKKGESEGGDQKGTSSSSKD